MEKFKLVYPNKKEGYLKELFSKKEEGVAISVGSVILKNGEYLQPKTLDKHEVSLLLSGRLEVTQMNGSIIEMQSGDFIFINKDEIRSTRCLEDSQIIYFLFKKRVQ
jgi:quercetin dioxygenase-like cupin family protein